MDDKKPRMLSSKRKAFCEHYVKHFNAAQAAREAGYSEKTAAEQGYSLLQIDEIRDYVRELSEAQTERTLSDGDKVVEELSKIGYANIKNYYKVDGELIPIHELPDEIAAAIHSTKVTHYRYEDGSEKTIREFKLHDKLRALEDLGNHHRIFDKERNDEKLEEVKLTVSINRNKREAS